MYQKYVNYRKQLTPQDLEDKRNFKIRSSKSDFIKSISLCHSKVLRSQCQKLGTKSKADGGNIKWWKNNNKVMNKNWFKHWDGKWYSLPIGQKVSTGTQDVAILSPPTFCEFLSCPIKVYWKWSNSKGAGILAPMSQAEYGRMGFRVLLLCPPGSCTGPQYDAEIAELSTAWFCVPGPDCKGITWDMIRAVL